MHQKGNFAAVKEDILKHILLEEKAVSVNILQGIYGIDFLLGFSSIRKHSRIRELTTTTTFLSPSLRLTWWYDTIFKEPVKQPMS